MTKQEFFGKFKSLFLWANLTAMVLVVVLAFFGLKWFLGAYTHHGENIEVPDLYGKDLGTATRMLEDSKLVIRQVATTYDRKLPGGCIVVQSPKAGASVKEGRQVYVTVNSLSAPKVRIPEVIGIKSYRTTQADLLSLEFELTDPLLVDGPRDLVMGILCEGRPVDNGDEVAKYSRMTLKIGNGAGDYSGTSVEELEEWVGDDIEQDETHGQTGDEVVPDDFFEVFE